MIFAWFQKYLFTTATLVEGFSVFGTSERLFVTTMNQFDLNAYTIYNRWVDPDLYKTDEDAILDSLKPENLFIGDKALIYAYHYNNDLYKNFW